MRQKGEEKGSGGVQGKDLGERTGGGRARGAVQSQGDSGGQVRSTERVVGSVAAPMSSRPRQARIQKRYVGGLVWMLIAVAASELEMSECSDTPARLRIETYDAHGGMDCAPLFRRLDAPGA